MKPSPLLTIAVPAYNRVTLLRRCLESVLVQATDDVEVVVSDDSTSDAPGELAQGLLRTSPVRSAYVRNIPSKGMAANWNACVQLATGRYVLLLHDDDFLYPGAISLLRNECGRWDWHVGLFGVQVVDERDRRVRHLGRRGHGRRYLPPADAVSRVLSHSSFIRFPGMVVSRSAYECVGPFDEAVGPVADLHMWTRLLQRYGLWMLPGLTSAYRVHRQALTSSMWQPRVVAEVDSLFSDVAGSGLLSPPQLEAHRASWFHRFLLAGALRELRDGNTTRARDVLCLFDMPQLRSLQRPLGWRCVRSALSLWLAVLETALVGGQPAGSGGAGALDDNANHHVSHP